MSYFRLLYLSSTAGLAGTLGAVIADRWRFLVKVNAQPQPHDSTECKPTHVCVKESGLATRCQSTPSPERRAFYAAKPPQQTEVCSVHERVIGVGGVGRSKPSEHRDPRFDTSIPDLNRTFHSIRTSDDDDEDEHLSFSSTRSGNVFTDTSSHNECQPSKTSVCGVPWATCGRPICGRQPISGGPIFGRPTPSGEPISEQPICGIPSTSGEPILRRPIRGMPSVSGEPVCERPTISGKPVFERAIRQRPSVSEQPVCGRPSTSEESICGRAIFGKPSGSGEPICGKPSISGKPICGKAIRQRPSISQQPICGRPSTSGEPICGRPSTSRENRKRSLEKSVESDLHHSKSLKVDPGTPQSETFQLHRRRRPADEPFRRRKPSELHHLPEFFDPSSTEEAIVRPPIRPALSWTDYKEGPPATPIPKFCCRNIIEYKDFLLCYDNQTRTVSWTLEHVVSKDIEKIRWCPPADREESRVPADFRSGDSDYRSSKDRFKKQHAAEIDYHVDRRREYVGEACVYTNVFPQAKESECHVWTLWDEFYDYVLDLSRFVREVIILTGALYLPQQNEDGTWSVKYELIGANKVAVPTHFYKVIACPNWDDKIRFECYKFENKLNIDMDLKKYVIPRHDLEKLIGFTIFDKVPDSKISSVREHPPHFKKNN